MKKHVIMLIVVCSLTGCASFDRMDATHHSLESHLVAGFDVTNKLSYIPWCFPKQPLGPYRQIDGINAKVLEGSYKDHWAVFYLGKSEKTGKWEVFSAMIYDNGKWKLLPVTLPEAGGEQTTSPKENDVRKTK